MINLYSLRNQKKEPNNQQNSNDSSSQQQQQLQQQHANNLSKSSPAQLRAAKDFGELSLPSFVSITQPDQNDVMNYKVTIKPDEGYYRGGKFSFDLKIPQTYPHEPPKLKCETRIYHPNIDQDGNVCLNILREDWKPVLTIGAIIYGLIYLFLEPNPEDPLNKEAAELLKNDKRHFENNVKKFMQYHR